MFAAEIVTTAECFSAIAISLIRYIRFKRQYRTCGRSTEFFPLHIGALQVKLMAFLTACNVSHIVRLDRLSSDVGATTWCVHRWCSLDSINCGVKHGSSDWRLLRETSCELSRRDGYSVGGALEALAAMLHACGNGGRGS